MARWIDTSKRLVTKKGQWLNHKYKVKSIQLEHEAIDDELDSVPKPKRLRKLPLLLPFLTNTVLLKHCYSNTALLEIKFKYFVVIKASEKVRARRNAELNNSENLRAET